jgi:mono/diheme cytochrome c family protein
MKIFLSIIFTIIVLCILGIIFIYSGIYDVSAAKPEAGFAKWVLSTTMDNSVEHHSKNIKVPNLDNPARIAEGFAEYKSMCEECHGAPGKKETELAKGLNPHAPNLSRSGQEMSAEELFWVTKNGVKMTGMPAWGKTHPDNKIWSLVAAMKKLHETTPEQYNAYPEEHEGPGEEQNSNVKETRYH